MKKITLLSVVALLCLQVSAQPTAIKPLTVGDAVPDILFNNVLNYKNRSAKLSDFKGKVVILDLWSTWCRSCIEAFPKMEQLQQQFNDDIQILLVNPYDATHDSDEKIQAVLADYKNRTGKVLTLPVAVRDTIINHLFPHKTVPHVIVIDQVGNIAGVTPSWAITARRIEAVLNGEEKVFPFKNENAFDRKKPLLLNGNGGDAAHFIYRSLFTGYIDEAGSYIGTGKDLKGKISRYYIINYPLLSIYRLAYFDELDLPSNRTIIETPDPYLWQPSKDKDEEIQKSFCYELMMPAMEPQKISDYLRQDLERYFNITVVKEKRLLACYILKQNKNIARAYAKQTDTPLVKTDGLLINKIIQNQPVKVLLDYLNAVLDKPLADETSLTQHITLALPANSSSFDFKDWQNFLAKSGFDLEVATRQLEVAVIKNIQ